MKSNHRPLIETASLSVLFCAPTDFDVQLAFPFLTQAQRRAKFNCGRGLHDWFVGFCSLCGAAADEL